MLFLEKDPPPLLLNSLMEHSQVISSSHLYIMSSAVEYFMCVMLTTHE